MHRVNAGKYQKWRHQRGYVDKCTGVPTSNHRICPLSDYIFFLKKRISKVNLSPHKNLLFKKNNDLHLCKKNATLQHSETANYAGKLLVQTLKKKIGIGIGIYRF